MTHPEDHGALDNTSHLGCCLSEHPSDELHIGNVSLRLDNLTSIRPAVLHALLRRLVVDPAPRAHNNPSRSMPRHMYGQAPTETF